MRRPTGYVARWAAAGLLAAGLAAGPGTAAYAGVAARAPATAASEPPGVLAPDAELETAASRADLWSRSSAAEVPMGSITKVMTAYVVIEAGDLGREITVPSGITAYDSEYGASTAGLAPGERLTARELLYALLIPSGCDAAYTLADAYGG